MLPFLHLGLAANLFEDDSHEASAHQLTHAFWGILALILAQLTLRLAEFAENQFFKRIKLSNVIPAISGVMHLVAVYLICLTPAWLTQRALGFAQIAEKLAFQPAPSSTGRALTQIL